MSLKAPSHSKSKRSFLAMVGPWWLLLSALTQAHSCLSGLFSVFGRGGFLMLHDHNEAR